MKTNLKKKINDNNGKSSRTEVGLRPRGGPWRCPESVGGCELAGRGVEALSRPSAWGLAQSRWPERWCCLGRRRVVSGRGAGRC